MLVDGEKYLPVNTDGNSTFEIPVAALDTALAVTADTVAMSTPHEIDYTLTFDSATLAAARMRRAAAFALPALLLAGCAAASQAPAQTDALTIENRYPLEYAKQFTVDVCAGRL